ncbi:hypothetical protein [Dactylosporangium sp. NPDC051541]|uniref:hypothetical protein n=1 Tax=Dactylosporangium sp. NPDC051541 TaxID=3363977 RepID=UPI0037B084CB
MVGPARECWFCGDATASPQHERVVGLHIDIDTTMTWTLRIRTRWYTGSVRVPRCARCRRGHRLEQALPLLAVAAFIAYVASGQFDELLGITPAGSTVGPALWAVPAALPALAWIAARRGWLRSVGFAPRGLAYGRRYPEVRQMRADGWKWRSGPFPSGLRDWDLIQAASTTSRPRRIIATVAALLGLAAAVVTVVLYFQGSELAAVAMVAALLLFFLASRLNPEP